MSTTLTVRVSDEVKHQLDALARSTGRTRSWLVFEAIRQYIELENWQISEIHEALTEADAGDFADEEEVADVFRKWGGDANSLAEKSAP